MKPIRSADFSVRQARGLLWRAGFGGTAGQARTLAEWGPARAVDYLLDTDSISYAHKDDGSFADDIMVPLSEWERQEFRRARQTGDEETVSRFRTRRQNMQRKDRKQIAAIQRWWLARMIETPKPLEEKMTLFWHGHFVSGYRAVENSYHLLMQNNLFRANALGSFSDLLRAIIRDPAMLEYLDNKRSRKQAPNENLARELMELFSLGVGGYTEKDIKEGARALTGYSYEGNEFVFNRRQHDPGTKTILGVTGSLDGDGFVDAILRQRACAEYMSWKLYRYFVADIGPDFREAPAQAQAVIRKMATTMRKSRFEVKPVLRELFLSEHFYDRAVMDCKIKTPVELLVGAIRSLGAPTRKMGTLIDALDLMGQNLFEPPNVAGWPGGRSWVNTSTLFARQNTLTYLLTGMKPGMKKKRRRNREDASSVTNALVADLGAPADDADLLATALLEHLLGGAATPLRPDRQHAVVRILEGRSEGRRSDALRDAITLVTALPEYQLC